MRAPGWLGVVVVGWVGLAAADPKPTEVDAKAFRDRLVVLQDARGGTYAVLRDPEAGNRVFYGKGKELYAQRTTGASSDSSAGTWTVTTWAPRLPSLRPGAITRAADGTFKRDCDGLDDAGLTEITGDQAKKLLATVKLMTPYNDRIPALLARDDAGVYYYVDRLFHGEGYRVFIGKKGAMKQAPLSDVAIDQAGSVFSTKSGDLRLVTDHDDNGNDGKRSVKWIRGDKNTELRFLDVDAASALIYKDLGIYGVLGTLCDNA